MTDPTRVAERITAYLKTVEQDEQGPLDERDQWLHVMQQRLQELAEALNKAERAAQTQELAGNEGDADAIRRSAIHDAQKILRSSPEAEPKP